VHTFGGEITRVPGATIKNTCLIVCRLWSLQFWLFTASICRQEKVNPVNFLHGVLGLEGIFCKKWS